MSPQRSSNRPQVPLAALAVLSVLAAAAAGCDSLLFPTEEYIIEVDSLSAPAALAATDTLTMQFYGTVGSSGCYRLVRVERQVASGGMELRFHGERKWGDCFQMPVALEHEVRVPPPLQHPFTIKVMQPSGPPLEQVVRIE